MGYLYTGTRKKGINDKKFVDIILANGWNGSTACHISKIKHTFMLRNFTACRITSITVVLLPVPINKFYLALVDYHSRSK